MAREEGAAMISTESIKFELTGRLDGMEPEVGKTHVSVRWEPGAKIVRVGLCLENYNWDTRMTGLKRLLAFEAAHADEFALEFDIIPLVGVRDEEYAEA
jgi:hypothetical protein